jgi:DNA polymerase-1
MKLLIDTEGFLVPAAKSAEYDIEWQPGDWQKMCRHGDALAYFQESVVEVLAQHPDHQPVLAMGDRTTYRAGIFPAYKANRKKESKVAGWPALVASVEQLAQASGWEIARLANVEADDVLGILAGPDDVIVSIDKDLLTVPGNHYRGGTPVIQSLHAANLAFFSQALIGDRSDHYPGCPGVGEKGAEKLLADLKTEAAMWATVVGAYQKAGLTAHSALVQARCARILRPGEYDHDRQQPILWQPPVI